MDVMLFNEMLAIDSTSEREGELADFLVGRLKTEHNEVKRFEGVQNVMVSWGQPRVVFCTHLDTVPPYIGPEVDGGIPLRKEEYVKSKLRGRGTCDAKGQIFAMWEACKVLEAKGYDGFGLLLLAGEETGSFGAKAFRDQHPGAEWVIVG